MSGLAAERKRRGALIFMKPFFKEWKRLKARKKIVTDQQKKNEKEATRLKEEGAVESFLRRLDFLPANKKLTVAAMQEFIRVNGAKLKMLDPNLWKTLKRTGKANLVNYIGDVIESGAEPMNGFSRNLLALENASSTTTLAIEDA